MPFFADLHIHSSHSRATSRDFSPETIWRWAQLKGISVIGTGDFTHPGWFGELREKLEPLGNGLYSLKKDLPHDPVPASCKSDVHFLLSAEISCIYSRKGKTRKVHCLIFVSDFSAAAKIVERLSKIGNLRSDGRPILGLDAKELLRITLDLSADSMLVPAHAWTPHFSVFGAASGFDSLEECFEELTPHVHAIETGLSSDPSMNWRLSSLDRIALISNSDAHSPAKIGREANIFDTEITYSAIRQAIETKKGLVGTVEFFPEEGKYHYDGHRACGVSMAPAETIQNNSLCPACGKKVTIGVMHRVEKLADREEGFRPKGAKRFHLVVPLAEVIGEVLRVGPGSKAVARQYFSLLEGLGSELRILMDSPLAEIARAGSSAIAEAVGRARAGDISMMPGFDGQFGKISLSEIPGCRKFRRQSALFF